MKNLFQKNRYRLRDAEKNAIWQQISLARAPLKQRRRWLMPAWSATAIAACGLAFLFLVVERSPESDTAQRPLAQPEKKVHEEGLTPTEPLELSTEAASLPATPPKASAKAEKRHDSAAVPTESDTRPAVTSGAADRRAPAADAQRPETESKEQQPAERGSQYARIKTLSDSPSRPQTVVAGTLHDVSTGERLPYAEILIQGETDSMLAVWDGTFTLSDLQPDRTYALQVQSLGYAEVETTFTPPSSGYLEIALNLKPESAVLLAALDSDSMGFGSDSTWGNVEPFNITGYTGVGSRAEKEKKEVEDYAELQMFESNQPQALQPPPVTGDQKVSSGLYHQRLSPPQGEGEDSPKGGCIIPLEHIWVPPNDQAYDTMYFEHYGVNPFIVTEEDALSTFAIDVDNASYTVMRRYVRDGHLPPHDAVRVEEYINFFGQDYSAVEKDDFAIYADGAPSPFGKDYHLLRIGVQGRDIVAENRRPAQLVFVIDVSGSMRREDRLELVKRALYILLDELQEGDAVGIVVYGSRGRVVLESTPIEERERLEEAIASLAPGGSTNAEEGLLLGYEMARRNYQVSAINRLVLFSDGVANQGRTGADSILERVRNESDRGIGLSTIGFGMGNYNDVLMEKLADHGDGNYYYVDNMREAKRVLKENLTGTLQTIARDTKIQVEFDPENVLRYRLLGYENRDVADEDFRNDAVDAGEVGAGHQVTALYEIKLSEAAERGLAQEKSRRAQTSRLATVRLRYQKPAHEKDAGDVKEIDLKVTTTALSPSFRQAATRLQLAAVVAEYAEILRRSYWAKKSRITDLVPMVDHIAAELKDDEAVLEFQKLVRLAADRQDNERPKDKRTEEVRPKDE